jgi:hypothetical protein
MSRRGIEHGPPAWEASTLEKTHLDSLLAGYSEPLIGLMPVQQPDLYNQKLLFHNFSGSGSWVRTRNYFLNFACITAQMKEMMLTQQVHGVVELVGRDTVHSWPVCLRSRAYWNPTRSH